MYILLFIVVLLVILFIMKSNVQVETFTNIGKNVFSQVRHVDFTNNNNNKYNNEVNTCEQKKHKFKNYDFAYRSKYDATGCIPCKTPPKCSEHNYKCVDEQTGYNVQDNCVEDGICRINEDVINMYPVKTCIDKKNKN
jgi:hypothetical protein